MVASEGRSSPRGRFSARAASCFPANPKPQSPLGLPAHAPGASSASAPCTLSLQLSPTRCRAERRAPACATTAGGGHACSLPTQNFTLLKNTTRFFRYQQVTPVKNPPMGACCLGAKSPSSGPHPAHGQPLHGRQDSAPLCRENPFSSIYLYLAHHKLTRLRTCCSY